MTIRRRWCWVPSRPTLAKRFVFEVSFLVSAFPAARRTQADVYVGYSPAMSSAILARLAAAPWWPLRYGATRPRWSWHQTEWPHVAADPLEALAAVEMATARGARPAIAITDGFVEPRLRGCRVREYCCARQLGEGRHAHPHRRRHKEMRERFAPNDEILAVHTGSMGVKQALWQIIDAAKLATEQGDAIQFVLVGDGGGEPISKSWPRV
ncbi:MAG: hypothetical protein R2706_07600 [Acidimicrobiales bacterium]